MGFDQDQHVCKRRMLLNYDQGCAGLVCSIHARRKTPSHKKCPLRNISGPGCPNGCTAKGLNMLETVTSTHCGKGQGRDNGNTWKSAYIKCRTLRKNFEDRRPRGTANYPLATAGRRPMCSVIGVVVDP